MVIAFFFLKFSPTQGQTSARSRLETHKDPHRYSEPGFETCTHWTSSAALTFTWQPYGNRFKHNPAYSFARVGKLLFLLKAGRTRQTAAGYQVLPWQEVLLTRQQQNKAPVALDSIHGAGE